MAGGSRNNVFYILLKLRRKLEGCNKSCVYRHRNAGQGAESELNSFGAESEGSFE